jgi:hypothetical protein
MEEAMSDSGGHLSSSFDQDHELGRSFDLRGHGFTQFFQKGRPGGRKRDILGTAPLDQSSHLFSGRRIPGQNPWEK